MMRGTPLGTMVVVTVTLFMDAFLYGIIIPLTANSPAAVDDHLTLAITYGAYAVGVLVATPILGTLTDRVGRRGPMVAGVLCQGLATLLFAVGAGVPELMVARVVQGVAAAAIWTAGLALVADTFTQKRTQMMGIAMMGSSGGSVLGPVVGGGLLEWGGYQLPFMVAGALVVVDLALQLALLRDPPRQPGEPAHLVTLLRDRGVIAAALVVLVVAAGWGLVEPLLPDYLRREAGAGAATIGLLFTISTLVNGLCAPLIGNAADRFGQWPTMFFGLALMAVTLPLLGLSASVMWAGAALVLVNVSYGFGMNPSLSELADAVDRRGSTAYGAVYAIYNVAFSVGMIGSNLLGGVLAGAMSFLAALGVISVAILILLLVIYFVRPRGAAALPASGNVSGP